ncbi:hypothetical protein T459_27585 [Capsicum annuum]|uniref:NHL repeat-containing protein 2 n=1 Tax=Capsicum annuum TaxID=4072 RepID=A0A1U8ELL5_CAPAN|nr:uncharacterized protein LOC107847981 isoform X2 [Capsicum annuum]KAF3656830.1 putative AP-1 complex subunit gamma-2-like [Capsicum annuum]PHT68098.1 hypothetical protein T459_27585 [Capsicum annuum]
MASLISTLCIFFFLLNISLTPVVGEVIFEDGYSVSTVIDGNKIKINPHSIIPVSGGFIILDSTASTFYTLSYNKDSDFSVTKLTGTDIGYEDGSLDKAKFNKPRSFVVDSKGNIYVADMKNMHAIRKISKSGVTTIAGGNSKTAGRADGPGLNASFSDDYELYFVPERCTLMISDHGNRLVREIQLKAEDCSRDSHSGLRAVSTWFLTVGLPCLVCLILGFLARPYVIPNDHRGRLWRNMTWKPFLISLEKQVLMFCFGIRSVVVDSNIYSLLRRLVLLSFSHLRLMFSPKVVVVRQTSHRQPAPLINFHDFESKESAKAPVVVNSLEDLITFDGSLDNSELTANQDDTVKESIDVSVVDSMILANIKVFAEQGNAPSGPEVSQSILSLVNQKKKVV